MEDFKNKVVLITGAGKGSGRRLAKAFAARGAQVAMNDITPINLETGADEIHQAGGRVKMYVEDIAKKMPVQTLLNSVLDDMGKIDILVNCAEVEPVRTILEMDDWEWQRTLEVNLTGAFLLTQSTGRIMKENGGGTIIHLSIGPKDGEKRTAYLASKAGLATFIEQVKKEYAPYGIFVHLAQTEDEVMELCCL